MWISITGLERCSMKNQTVPACKSAALIWRNPFVGALLLTLLSACTKAQQPLLEKFDTLTVPYGIQSMAWHPNGKWLAVGYFLRDEVEVWDVKTKTSVLKVPSMRRSVNQSGQEVLFSPDGRYLVVQDTVDTKKGEPKFPKNYEDPAELPAQQDKERLILARIWDIEQRKEIAQLKGPGSSMHGGGHKGMYWLPSKPTRLTLLRSTGLAVYEPVSGELLYEVNLRFPFADKPEFNRGYEKMSCSTSRDEIALDGGPLMKKAPVFGYPENSGATPIVVVDMERKAIKKVLFSATPLNGVAYTADGSKLISFGMSPMRVWSANSDYSLVGEITDPNENVGEISKVSSFNGLMGMSLDVHFWTADKLKLIYSYKSPLRDVFRIETHLASNLAAFAVGRSAHLFRINDDVLKQLEK
jgi:hypothetical protein